jgi:hypothetical protein
VAVYQTFKPSLSPQQVKDFRRLYDQQPDKFNDQTIQALEQHAEYYKLPFAKSNQSFIKDSKDVMLQAAKGFGEGLTTLRVGDPPKNDAEAIARNVGHLAGFVGFIPSSPFTWANLHKTAATVKALKGTSVPMWVAGRAQKMAARTVSPIYNKAIERRVKAGLDSKSWLTSEIPKDILAGAFHLGVASSVSSWQGGVDEMMDSFIHGAGAGAFFRGLGNAVKTGNEAADKSLRTIAASLFQGLPATFAGETTPIQVYQYLLGGYFGFNESPVSVRLGKAHIEKMKVQYNPETNKFTGTSDPAEVKGWDKLDQVTKDYVIKNYKEDATSEALSYEISKKALGKKELLERQALAKAYKSKEDAVKKQIKKSAKGKEEIIETENQFEDSDPQTIPERLTHSSKKFVDKYLEIEDATLDKRIEVAADLDAEWSGLIKKGVKNNENPASAMIDYIRNKYGTISTQAEDFWVNYGFRKLKDKPVLQFTLEDGEFKRMPLDESWSVTDAAGNRKLLVHEPKLIEEVFNKASKEESLDFKYGILDHIIFKTPTGFQRLDVNKYKEKLSRYETIKIGNNIVGATEKNINIKISKEFGKIFRKLDKEDMYYYGGKGDSENLFLVKYHPGTPKDPVKRHEVYREIFKTINNTRKSSKKERDAFFSDRKRFIATYKDSIGGKTKAAEIYDKSFISNVLYEVGLNGFEGGLKDVSKVLKEGFINDAASYNKRAQIWFTNGYSSDPKAVAKISAKLKKGEADIDNGELNIKIVTDIAKDKKAFLGSPSSFHEEVGDGAIYGRSDVITALNRQAGLPEEGGVNKSFIASPDPKFGALLGKYMIHPVTPAMEAYMLNNKLHLIIPETAAKQVGLRGDKNTLSSLNIKDEDGKLITSHGKFSWKEDSTNEGGTPSIKSGITWKLPIKDIKIVMSETTGLKKMDTKRVPKQMWTNFTPYGFFDPSRSGIKDESIYHQKMTENFNDMYENLVIREMKGTDEYNTLVDRLISDPIAFEKSIPKIVNNLDSIGMEKLLDAIKAPGNEKFANKVYKEIHKLNYDILEDIRADGELTNKEIENLKSDMNDYSSVNERIISLMPDSVAGFLHKFPRDYRMSVMRNYFIHRLTRPNVGNSMSARMRPYEITMFNQKDKGKFVETERLEREDDIFFLGDVFKDKKVDVSAISNIKKPISLGELWSRHQSDPVIQDFFEALVVRTPMDSLSGAHKLKFAGFTGIKDMGILLHGRSMKALGGADLDGDTASIFFGGRNSKGEGSGFKKEWKDIYDWSKNEYVSRTKGQNIEDDSKAAFDPIEKNNRGGALTYQEQLTIDDPSIISARKSNSFLQYSPRVRREVSLASSEGRDDLGVAVTQSSSVRSAYSSIRASGEAYTFKVYRKGKPINVYAIPKKDSESLKSFRGLTRASIGLASDPMNEAGLNFGKYGERLFNKQMDRLFEFKTDKKVSLTPKEKRKALVDVMSNVNRGLYGKDYKRNRRFQIWEIMEKLRGANEIKPENRNNFLSKLSRDVQQLDWSDKLFFRIDKDKLSKLYRRHEEFETELAPLKDLMYRTSMKVPEGDFIKLVYDYNLHTQEGFEKQLTKNRWKEDLLDHLVDSNGDPIYTKKNRGYVKDKIDSRRIALNDVLLKAEDYIIKDISDMASFKVMHELSKHLSKKQIRKIINDADYLKKNSYLLSKRSRRADTIPQDLTKEELVEKQKLGESIYGEEQSASLTQSKIDSEIRKYKENYTKDEAAFFDAAMLGTIWRGKMDLVEANLMEHGKPKGGKYKKDMQDMIDDSSKTSLSKLGYASEAIPDSSVKRMLNEYQNIFNTTSVSESNEAQNILKESEKIKIKDIYVDKETKDQIDKNLPFVDLKKGTINKKQMEIRNELFDHLDHYGGTLNKKLNSFVREIVGKDINIMNEKDWQIINRYLRQARDGTWWSTLLGKPNNELSKWYYMMFPKTVDYDVMRREIKLFKQRKPVQTKAGIITANVGTPEGMMTKVQNTAHTLQQNATQLYEEENRLWEDKISPYRDQIEDGLKLFHIAVRKRELGIPEIIRSQIEKGKHPKKLYNEQSKVYFDDYHKLIKQYEYDKLKNKIYDVSIGENVQKLTGEQVVGRINDVITDTMGRMQKLISGRQEAYSLTEWEKDYQPLLDKEPYAGDYKAVNKFVKKMEKAMLKGERVDLSKLGLDGTQFLTHSQIKSTAGRDIEIRNRIDKNWKPEETSFYPKDNYFPHIGGDIKAARTRLNELAKKIDSDKTLSKKEKRKEMEKAIWSFSQLTNDFVPDMDLITKHEIVKDALDNIALKKQNKKQILNTLFKNPRVGHQFSRTGHIQGWSIEPDVVPRYMKSVIDSLHKHAAQIKMRSDIGEFYKKFMKKTNDRELANNWSNFYTMYAQEALGYPQQIPESVLQNPGMKIKGTPFALVNDTAVINNLNRIRKKLGIDGSKKYKGLDVETASELEKIDFNTINKWSNLEAKYQLATLLAHPKSAVTNLYGGTAHTVVSAGWQNFRKARDWEYLIKNVNNKWKGKEDIEKWVQSLGVVEDWILYEAGMNPQFKGQRWKSFFNEAVPIITKDPNASDARIMHVAKKHGISAGLFDKAAYFMRRPERALRRDAFMAHYLQARQKFAGAIKRFDDPILIKMALEGVKSTQFLYSAPFRPAFARSSMGKVLTRFQLWAWNSVRFRADIIREANIYGFKQGTPEFERFKRMALMDMLMYGLSNVFMYSIFENGLPQPYAWLQDFADWAFGNEKERSRAFYGTYPSAIAPLQIITPPLGRPFIGAMKAMMDDDWAQLAGYTGWSMIPFGRMGYDIFGNPLKGGKGGLIENPYRFVEKVSGIPYQQIPRQIMKYREDPDDKTFLGPRFTFNREEIEEDEEV